MADPDPGPDPAVDPVPPTRWELMGESNTRYAECFEDLIDRGQDIEGEARLADVLAPRGARVLDAGAGIGRVAAALARRGHDVTAVEKDPDLVARSRSRFPDVPVVESDILRLSPSLLEAAGRPTSYDLIVAVGNVMVFLADDTEVRALRTLGDLLSPGGRMLVGFHPQQGPGRSRDYAVEHFRRHVTQAGLVVESVFGTYDLEPPSADYVVAVLHRAGARQPPV
jgi:SAM-dependent methyltransferase